VKNKKQGAPGQDFRRWEECTLPAVLPNAGPQKVGGWFRIIFLPASLGEERAGWLMLLRADRERPLHAMAAGG